MGRENHSSARLFAGTGEREERRKAPRYPIALPLTISNSTRHEGSDLPSGKTVNLSGRGVYFLTDRHLALGAEILLTMTARRGNGHGAAAVVPARARVVRLEHYGPGNERLMGVAAEIEYYCA